MWWESVWNPQGWATPPGASFHVWSQSRWQCGSGSPAMWLMQDS